MSIEPAIQNETSSATSRSTDRSLLLQPIDGAEIKSIVTIERKESTLGSSEECDVPLPLAEIAAHHVTILDCEEEWTLRAHDEKTWINGKSVQFSDLKDGDRLKIGSIEFEIALKTLSDEDRSVIRNTAKPSTKKRRTTKSNRKKKSAAANSKSRSRSKTTKNSQSVDESLSEISSLVDQISQNEVAECVSILKSLQDELKKETAEMNKVRKDLEQEREHLQEEREKLSSERQSLQDGFGAISQAREALKAREIALEDHEQITSRPLANSSDQDVHSLYRKSEEEKLSELRSELANKFHIDIAEEQNNLESQNPEDDVPDFSESELADLESAVSLDHPDNVKQQTEQVGETDSSKEEDLSVQEYMQGLLQRSRQDSPNDETGNSHREDPDWKLNKPDDRRTTVGSVDPESSDENKTENPIRHQIDKQSVRADMQSMREIANISARSAIAQHSTKRLKFSILLKLVLAVFSFSLATVILLMSKDGFHIAIILQAGAVSIGAITLVEVLRSFSQAQKAVLGELDQQCEDSEEAENFDYEINDSAILNHPEFISAGYQSNLADLDSELPTNEIETEDQTATIEDHEDERDLLGIESYDEIDEQSSKDTSMIISDDSEFDEES